MDMIPHIEQVNGKSILFVNGNPTILFAGEVHNSNSSSLEQMNQIWNLADQLNMNCLLLPISWELLEPEEGSFNFSLVEGLIAQAREHQKKIVFLWFGTWKNAQCSYAPEWVKTDIARFRRAQVEKGVNFTHVKEFYGIPYTSLSYLCEETMHADARAFRRLLAEIKKMDADCHTVVGVQVQNEPGLMGAAREHSDEADELFYSSIPRDLGEYLCSHTTTMVPEMKNAIKNGQGDGNWEEMFGEMAEEIFSAYYIAKYINTVAAAGKEEYALPMSVNCWLNKPGDPAGVYPSGGPISKVREVWRFAAPQIDIYAPDIYLPDFQGVCDEYTRRGESLYIPECATHSYAAARNILAVGKYHAMCYSPFGFEDMGQPLNAGQMALFGADATDPALKVSQDKEVYSEINSFMTGMSDKLTMRYGTSELQAATGEFADDTIFRFDDTEIQVRFIKSEGACLILRENENEFYILAYETALNFVSASEDRQGIDMLAFEEGKFEDSVWKRGRRLNGDEVVGNTFTAENPILLHVKTFIYQ